MASRFNPADAAKLFEEAKVRREAAVASERAEAERRRLAVEAREKAVAREQLRQEEGLRNQARMTLIAAISGASSLVVKGELFGRAELIERGFRISYRRPLTEKEVRARQISVADIEAEGKANAEEVDAAIENWIRGISCQDERIYENSLIIDEISDSIRARLDEYIEMRFANEKIEDYFEDYYESRSSRSPEFLRIIAPEIDHLIPKIVEWQDLVPEVPRVSRAIERLITNRSVLESRKNAILDEIQNGAIIGVKGINSNSNYEISWGHQESNSLWISLSIIYPDAHRWLSSSFGQNLFECIESEIKEIIDCGEDNSAEFVVVERPDGGWVLDGFTTEEDDAEIAIDCPPGEVLAEALVLIGWRVNVDFPNSHRTVISVSW
jgi:hypothetical protein